MKKELFMLCAAGLTLASCSQEDVFDIRNTAPDNSIAFRARTFKTTRAQELTTANLESFMVYGFKGLPEELEAGEELTEYFDGAVEFKKTASTTEGGMSIFRADQTYYWPSDINTFLYFPAYAPSVINNVEATKKGELKFNNFTVNGDITEQLDLICATGAGSKEDEYDGVGMYFQHALSKIYVSKVRNDNPRYKYEVIGVRMGNIANSGDLTYNTWLPQDASDEELDAYKDFDWSAGEQTDKMTYIMDAPITVGADTELMSGNSDDRDGAFMLIPQQLAAVEKTSEGDETGSQESVIKYSFEEGVSYVALLVRITDTKTNDVLYPYAQGTDNVSEEINGVKYAWAAFPVGSLWEAGHFTDYIVTFSNGAGYIPGEAEGYDTEDYVVDNGDGTLSLGPVHVDLAFKPILGEGIFITEEVDEWYNGNEATVDEGSEGILNVGGMEDPWGE